MFLILWNIKKQVNKNCVEYLPGHTPNLLVKYNNDSPSIKTYHILATDQFLILRHYFLYIYQI